MRAAMKDKTRQPNRIKELLEKNDIASRAPAKAIRASAPHDLPFDKKFLRTSDGALLGSVIGWMDEAAKQFKVKLSPEMLSTWAMYVYKGAVEQPLAHQQTRYVAFTIVKVIQQVKK
jgi:hypothetical protein